MSMPPSRSASLQSTIDLGVFVKGDVSAGLELQQASHLAALGILVKQLDRDFFEAGRLPLHLRGLNVCRAADGSSPAPMTLSLLGANSNPCVRRHPQVIVNALEILKPRRRINWTSGRIRAWMRTAAPVLNTG